MTKIILHGCFGKMGQTIAEFVKETEDMQIVAGIDTTGGSADFPVFSCLSDCALEADVIIDFSAPQAIASLMETALTRKLPVVVCTTGLSKEQIAYVKDAAKQIPILFSANMSLGINLMVHLVKKAASILSESGFDIEIIEKHHNRKKDAPSGTALYLADAINSVFDYDFSYNYGRSHQTEPREKNEIGISSLRGGNIAGEHQVIFAGEDEIIEIHHKAGSRRIFAVGAIGAARFLKGKPAGLYTMGDVIGH